MFQKTARPDLGSAGDDRPDLDPRALFLDFDGTLVELADTPDGVRAEPGLAKQLTGLADRLDGALCIVTGRAIETIERHMPGYRGDIIAAHGVERRIGGTVECHPLAGSATVARLQKDAEAFARCDPGFLVEPKPAGVVLHFRRNPDLHSKAYRFMEAMSERFPDFILQPAKMAVEMKPKDVGKVDALKWLMDRPPYAGRRPCYFGDDATDEPAMEWVVSVGGCAVKVGEGETRANHRLAEVADVHAALKRWAASEVDAPCPTV